MRRLAPLAATLLLASPAAAETVTLAVSFSDAARAKLETLGEQVVVNAAYYGDPSAKGTAYADEIGQVGLGGEALTIWPRAQTVTLGGITEGLPRDLVAETYINVNIYSARFAHEDNLLACDLVDGALAEMAAQPQTALCKLITE